MTWLCWAEGWFTPPAHNSVRCHHALQHSTQVKVYELFIYKFLLNVSRLQLMQLTMANWAAESEVMDKGGLLGFYVVLPWPLPPDSSVMALLDFALDITLGDWPYYSCGVWPLRSMGLALWWRCLAFSAPMCETYLFNTYSFPTGQVQTRVSGCFPGLVSHIDFLF
jgi:hypothetical protein